MELTKYNGITKILVVNSEKDFKYLKILFYTSFIQLQ